MEKRLVQNCILAAALGVPFLITVAATVNAVILDRWTEVDRGATGGKLEPPKWPANADLSGAKRWDAVSGVSAKKAGQIVIKVKYIGPKIGRQRIQLGSFRDCAVVHGSTPVFAEQRLVNGDAVPWAFVKLDRAPSGVSHKTPPPRTLDQHGCVYVPHVLGLVKGQILYVRNGDHTAHNVNMQGPDPETRFNRGQGQGANIWEVPFNTLAEGIKTSCQIHSWMAARIHVVDHPFFCTTDQQGGGTIKMLPAGSYTLSVWHESFSGSSQTVLVTAGKATQVTFEVK